MSGDPRTATELVLRELGPEVQGYLAAVLGDCHADEVYSQLTVRLWRSFDHFQGRCSVRTWVYVLARHEIGRFLEAERKRAERHVPISAVEDVLAVARPATRSTPTGVKRTQLAQLRDELPIDDRSLLILRVDRTLSWRDIALAFADHPEALSEAELEREVGRLRKRFQLIKGRLVAQVRRRLAS